MSAPRCSISDGRLHIEWQERHFVMDGDLLRRHCRCAECRSLSLQGHPIDAGNVSLRSVAAMGYGVQLVFSDGHERGIFPWAYLAELAAAQ